jgi:hypothetical protein
MVDELIRFLLEMYTLEELLERLDITPERVLEILIEEGHVSVSYDLMGNGYDGQTLIEEEALASEEAEHDRPLLEE